jgi:catechol 2,3-dioxygenase-like lactoylglutathione lyase family enzyme
MNLNQVTVAVSDIPKAVAFYRQLGLRLIVDAPHYARFECPDGDATFSVHRAESVVPGNTAVYFEVADVDHEVARLQQLGVIFDAMPEDKSWLWREAWLRDPDGNVIVIYHAGVHRKNPPWRVG